MAERTSSIRCHRKLPPKTSLVEDIRHHPGFRPEGKGETGVSQGRTVRLPAAGPQDS
jgi:hypothetical protein